MMMYNDDIVNYAYRLFDKAMKCRSYSQQLTMINQANFLAGRGLQQWESNVLSERNEKLELNQNVKYTLERGYHWNPNAPVCCAKCKYRKDTRRVLPGKNALRIEYQRSINWRCGALPHPRLKCGVVAEDFEPCIYPPDWKWFSDSSIPPRRPEYRLFKKIFEQVKEKERQRAIAARQREL
ncbi:MAG: hypothetical protein GY757_10020 [bacterium]|nr:hypothetical protein [bacterium]